MKKRVFSLLLAVVMIVSLCACGKDNGPYNIIETLSEKQYGAVFRYGDKLADPVNAAISVLAANGSLSSICFNYFGSDNIIIDGSANAINDLGIVVEPRTLIVGMPSNYKPMSYEENGEIKGMNVDIANAIGALLGWDIKLQLIDDGNVGAQLSSGNIDCALGFGIETISAEKYSIGECYMKSSIVLASLNGSKINSFKDLEGKKVGIINDDSFKNAVTGSEKLQKYIDGATIYLYTSRCLNALSKDWCSAVVLDVILLGGYADSVTLPVLAEA